MVSLITLLFNKTLCFLIETLFDLFIWAVAVFDNASGWLAEQYLKISPLNDKPTTPNQKNWAIQDLLEKMNSQPHPDEGKRNIIVYCELPLQPIDGNYLIRSRTPAIHEQDIDQDPFMSGN